MKKEGSGLIGFVSGARPKEPKAPRQAEMESNKRNGNEISFVDGIEGGANSSSLWVGYRLRSSRQPAKEEDELAPTTQSNKESKLIQKDKLIEME